jgi:predicted DNA-binding transcriptional regulator YafY
VRATGARSWYLAAVDDGKLKTFGFTRISQVRLEGSPFQRDEAVETRLIDDKSLWQSDQPIKVMIRVAPTVARYFQRRMLLANQVIEETTSDGGLLLSAQVGHANEVLPIVRYWIPHLRFIEPVVLQQALDSKLLSYLDQTRSGADSRT